MDTGVLRTKEFKDLLLPPMYIMKMVRLWYDQEELHCMQRVGKLCDNTLKCNHFVLTLNTILSPSSSLQ